MKAENVVVDAEMLDVTLLIMLFSWRQRQWRGGGDGSMRDGGKTEHSDLGGQTDS